MNSTRVLGEHPPTCATCDLTDQPVQRRCTSWTEDLADEGEVCSSVHQQGPHSTVSGQPLRGEWWTSSLLNWEALVVLAGVGGDDVVDTFEVVCAVARGRTSTSRKLGSVGAGVV